MDSHPATDYQQEIHFFNEHIRILRTNPWTKYAYLTLFAERNTGHESGHLYRLMLRHKLVAAYMQPSKGDVQKLRSLGVSVRDEVMEKYMEQSVKNPGFFTDMSLKNEFRIATRKILAQDAVFYLDGCVSANPFLEDKDPHEKFIHTKTMFEEQLARCRTFSRRPTYDTSAPKISWSGKVDDAGAIQPGYNDDLAIIGSAAFYFWPLAMGGQLPGFPYDKVGMSVDEAYTSGSYHMSSSSSAISASSSARF